jgi:outer membrane biosynthesis protein TonB
MKKLIITEEERKSILGLHGIVEQTTPTTTPTPTQPTEPLTPAEQKRQEYLKKREAQKAANAARLAPIEAEQEKRIQNWIAANPGKTRDDYFKANERSDKFCVGGNDSGNKRGGSCGAATSLQKALNGK